MKKAVGRLYLTLVLIFLYAPIATLMVLSFNSSKSRAHWGGFTFEWYLGLISNEEIMDAFRTTVILAFLSAFIATILGTAACTGMQFMK